MTSRVRIVLLALGILALASPAWANEAIKIGSLKAANVGAAFIAKEKGYFAAEGLDVEFSYFDRAQPVAVGVTSGSLDFGCTSTSAGMYALAGQGVIKIISGMYSEAPGFHNFGIMASLKAYAAGVKSYKDLPGHSVAISQVGSPVHYSLALIAEKYHLDLKSMRIEPLQGIPQIVSAIEGNQVDASVNDRDRNEPDAARSQGRAARLDRRRGAVAGRDHDDDGQAHRREAANRRSLPARLQARRTEYHDAFTGPGETRSDGPNAAEVLAILSKYTGQPPEQIKLSVAYVDGDARVDVKDIDHQIDWFKQQKMLKDDIDPTKVMDMKYVVPLPGR